MKCEKCDLFMPIGNTEECGIGVCTIGNSWNETPKDHECKFTPEPFKCKDCGYRFDYGCYTVQDEDEPCGMFYDARADQIINILYDWKLRGMNIQEEMQKLIDEVNEYKVPKERT